MPGADSHAHGINASLTTRSKRANAAAQAHRLASVLVGDDRSLRSMTGGPGEDTKGHARIHAQTARLSVLTQFAPTYGPSLGRSAPGCLFASPRWANFLSFVVRTNAFRCGLSVWVSPLEMP
jgi:hypothetical protein